MVARQEELQTTLITDAVTKRFILLRLKGLMVGSQTDPQGRLLQPGYEVDLQRALKNLEADFPHQNFEAEFADRETGLLPLLQEAWARSQGVNLGNLHTKELTKLTAKSSLGKFLVDSAQNPTTTNGKMVDQIFKDYLGQGLQSVYTDFQAQII
ncbi:hypothetical protein HY440_02970 [Candidatus Microgenomates bacterium]|nr:hypothetical protein [Candidatus Microgenomates bacterium]